MSTVHMNDLQWNLLALWLNYHSIILNIDAFFPWVSVQPVPAVTCTVFCQSAPFLIISLPSLRRSSIRRLLGGERRRGSTEARVGVKTRQKRLSSQQNLLQFLSAASDCLFHSAISRGGDSFPLSASLPASHSLSGLLIYCVNTVWVCECRISVSMPAHMCTYLADARARAAQTVYVCACTSSIYMNSNRF